jgi:hypothetical protein
MDIPSEFSELCSYIDGFSHVEGYSPQRWISSGVTQFVHAFPQSQNANVIKRFLDTLLDTEYDEAALQEVWHKTGVGFFIADHRELRRFLEMIRDEISRKRPT